MPRGKLGRAAPVFSRRALAGTALMARALAPLGTPPSTSVNRFEAVKTWNMFANDICGCCVEADTAHDLLFRSTVAGSPVKITDDDVLSLYTAIAGFDPKRPAETDNGTNELLMSAYLVAKGFMGHKADAAVSLDPTNLDHLKWSIELFGSARLGVNLPLSAEQQFDGDSPWTVENNDGGISGRHDVRAFNYRSATDGVWFDVVTWGQVVSASEGWMRKYAEEAHAEIFADWCFDHGKSPAGYDLQTLLSDARSLS